MTSMIRLLRSIVLAGINSIPLAYSASSANSTALSVEIDVIFPIHNATYNITESLPIVFALHNLSAAATLGSFTFGWDIMPYGNVDGIQEPGGVTCGYASVHFTTANATTEPYIFVNQTDVQEWQYPAHYPYGSVYALQWSIQWDADIKPCDSDPLGVFGTLFFNIDINDPEPSLGT